MESIFENGYLKSEFINKSYRGLKGWLCDIIYRSIWKDEQIVTGKGLVLALTPSLNSNDQFIVADEPREIGVYKIPQFTPEDIPVGEICWGYDTDTNEWHKIVLFDQCYVSFGRWICRDQFLTVYEFPTPYLIAETAEDAERLKDWSK